MDKLKKTKIGEIKKIKIDQESLNCPPESLNKCCKPGPFFNPDYFGHVVVQTLEELNSIPCKLRQDGMVATIVQDNYSEWQIQSSRTGFGICDNQVWVKVSAGDLVYDGGNLFIFETEQDADSYISNSHTTKQGQMLYITELDNYYKFDGQDGYTDPFPNKLEVPTTQGTDETLEYKIPTYVNGKPYWRNATDFGKVDTIDGIEADENKDVKLGAVRKSESNEVEAGFDLHQVDGASISVSTNGLKVFKGGITATFGTTSIYVDNLVPDAAYKFQEILFPKRTVKNVEEKVYPVTYVNGVKADENGRVDISGVAMNWTNPSQRFSGLVDKSSDVTYNRVLVTNNIGQINYADLLTSEFIKFTENGKVGFALKYRKDNPTFYSAIGNNAVDLSIQTASSRGGASGNDSVAIGSMGKSTGVSSTSLGNSNTASGNNSLAAGTMNTANGSYSLALGYLNTASQGGDNAIGYKNIANGGYATAMGVLSEATGVQSVAMGTSSRAVGRYSTAIGYGVKSSTELSTAIGNVVESYSHNSIVMGSYNVVKTGQSQTGNPIVPTDDLFVIGNGFKNPTTGIATYSNALEIRNNGHTLLPSTTATMIEGNVKSVITKEYLDIRIPKPPTTGEYTLKSINGVVSWVLN